MGNYLTKIRSTINLAYFKTKFEQNRGKKRKHNFLNSTELSENNEFPEEEDDVEDDDDDEEDDIEEEEDDIEADNDFIAPSRPTTSNSILVNGSSTSNYRNIFARSNVSFPTSSNRLAINSRLRRRRHRTEVAKLIRNSSLIQPTSTSMLSLSTSNSNANNNTNNTSSISSKLSPTKMSSIDAKLMMPARKKMKSTTQYVYNTLFLNGENSDLVIRALNKDWHLHKIYLCQSPYFDSMFKNGSKWKESNQKVVEISIPDKNITEKALFTAFGSFYKEDIEIVPLEVTSVLACASLLSLDGLITQCETVMIESINHKSVFSFYEAALLYGVKHVADTCLKWLSYNIMSNSDIYLGDIKPQLFEKIISSNDLMIVQVETDLYTLCKKWLYFQINKSVRTLDKDWQIVTNSFFKSFLNNNNSSSSTSEQTTSNSDLQVNEPQASSSDIKKEETLLELPQFSKYLSIFRKIRLQHILTDMGSLNVLYNDRIIPQDWIEPYYFKNWLNTIYIDQDALSHEFEANRAEFDNECARFGRILNGDQATWRWVSKVLKVN